MIKSLLHGKLDAVIATQQIGAANLDYTKIDQEDFCLVASPDTVLPDTLKKNSDQLKEIESFLLERNWISYATELPIIRRFWHVAFKRRPNIEPVMVVPSLLLIRKAVESGLGVSVLPRYLCLDSLNTGRLIILWEHEEPVVNDLWIATRKVDRNKPGVEQLVSLLRYNRYTNLKSGGN